MNRDIAIMREKVVKLTQLLASRGIQVTQRGTQAMVRCDRRTGKPLSVNLPYIPDNASEELIAAIEGFLDHEVGHLLFTDFPVIAKANRMGSAIASMHNIIEDTLVERKMREKFPGSDHNLNTVGRFFLDNVTTPGVEAAEDLTGKFRYLIVPAARAWAGQKVFQDYMVDKWGILEPVSKKLGDLKDRIMKVKTSKEALDLAVAIHKALEEPPAPPPPPTPPMPTPPKDKEKSEEKEESEESAAGNEGDGEGENESEGADDEQDESKSSGDEQDDAEGDAGDQDEGDAGEGDDQDEGPEKGEGSLEGDDDQDEDAASGDDGAAGDEDEGDGEDEDDGSVGRGRHGIPDPGTEILEGHEDFDDSIAKVISKDAADAIKDAPYRLYTKDFDIIEPLEVPEEFDNGRVVQMDEECRHMVGVMQKDIERMMAAQSRVVRQPGQRSGRIHAGSLHRLAAGDSRVFYRKHESRSKDTAVTLLVDLSGSMSGTKVKLAVESAFALSSVLERVGVKHEVVGFTTRGHRGEVPGLSKAMIEVEQRNTGVTFSRWEALYMPIFKGWDERLTPTVKRRFAYLADEDDRDDFALNNNIDGECVEIAAWRLKQQRASRHVLMVLSDGNPACFSGSSNPRGAYAYDTMHELNAHLLRTVNAVERMGVECIGIGIEDSSVSRFYKKHVVLRDREELPGQVMKELRAILA